jgi:hypothetical protein
MSMQVLPTAPSPTVTHFMNLEALILPCFLVEKTEPSVLSPPFLSCGEEEEAG